MQETTARMDSKKNSYWRKKRKPMHCAPKSPWMLMCHVHCDVPVFIEIQGMAEAPFLQWALAMFQFTW